MKKYINLNHIMPLWTMQTCWETNMHFLKMYIFGKEGGEEVHLKWGGTGDDYQNLGGEVYPCAAKSRRGVA